MNATKSTEGIPLKVPERAGGRTGLFPKAPLIGLRKICGFAAYVECFEVKMVKFLVSVLHKCSADEIDDRMVQSVRQTDEQIQRMFERVQSMMSQWKVAKERLDQLVAKKSSPSDRVSE
jgi:hypothetical protein